MQNTLYGLKYLSPETILSNCKTQSKGEREDGFIVYKIGAREKNFISSLEG